MSSLGGFELFRIGRDPPEAAAVLTRLGRVEKRLRAIDTLIAQPLFQAFGKAEESIGAAWMGVEDEVAAPVERAERLAKRVDKRIRDAVRTRAEEAEIRAANVVAQLPVPPAEFAPEVEPPPEGVPDCSLIIPGVDPPPVDHPASGYLFWSGYWWYRAEAATGIPWCPLAPGGSQPALPPGGGVQPIPVPPPIFVQPVPVPPPILITPVPVPPEPLPVPPSPVPPSPVPPVPVPPVPGPVPPVPVPPSPAPPVPILPFPPRPSPRPRLPPPAAGECPCPTFPIRQPVISVPGFEALPDALYCVGRQLMEEGGLIEPCREEEEPPPDAPPVERLAFIPWEEILKLLRLLRIFG